MDHRFVSATNPRLKESLRAAVVWQKAEVDAVARRMDSAFKKHERGLFASEGAMAGSRWAPLSPAYARWKAKRFPGRKIMQRKGKLRRSLITKGSGHILRSGAQPRAFVEMGTSVDYAAFHIRGTHNKRQPKHERDTLAHSPSQAEQYGKIATEYMVRVKLPRAARILARQWHLRRRR